MIHISLDAMGGDHAPREIIKGATLALAEEKNLFITLTGSSEIINKELNNYHYPSDRIDVLDAEQVINNDDQPSLVLKKKKDSSMMKAISLVKEGKAQAVISAGNTGALMAGGLFILGRIPGIDRPALAIPLPTRKNGPTVLLDVGANLDSKVENLIQYAVLGKVYSNKVLGKDKPRIALLNVGVEQGKGNELVKKAYKEMEKDIDFIGNIEARELMQGVADVVVCDGFAGNILLKSIEGMAEEIFFLLKEEIKSSWRSKIGGTLLLKGFKRLKKRMDYSEYGGAPLLGIKGLVVKAHGSSDATAIKNAILSQAFKFVSNKCVEEIEGYVEINKKTS